MDELDLDNLNPIDEAFLDGCTVGNINALESLIDNLVQNPDEEINKYQLISFLQVALDQLRKDTNA